MKKKLEDDLDKMGPRLEHCLEEMHQSCYLTEYLPFEELPPAKPCLSYATFIMVQNLQGENIDFLKFIKRLTVWFTTLQDDFKETNSGDQEEGEVPDGTELTPELLFDNKFAALMPTKMHFILD